MAASLPLLVTACGGPLEIVQDGVTGLLHPPPSAGEAADKMLLGHMLRLDRRTAAGCALGEQLGTAGCGRDTVAADVAAGVRLQQMLWQTADLPGN